MTLSLSDMTTPDTKLQAQDTLLAFLELQGFPVSSWQPGSVPRTLIEGEAEAYADLTTLVALIARGGFLDTAEGDWLTLLARDIYGLERQPAIQTRGTIRLVDDGGIGPVVLAPGDVIVTDSTGLRFRNVGAGTLPFASEIDLLFEAEATGSKYNLPNNIPWQLVTSLPSVNVLNPGGVSGWISQQGTDRETDVSLRARCRARWPGSTYMLSTAATYEAAARTASAEVAKVKVFPNNPDPGKVKVVLAGTSGSVSGSAVTAVTAYIADRLPLCVAADVASAASVALVVEAELWCQPAYQTTVISDAITALAAFQAALDIGQTVYRSALIEVLMSVTGMVNVVLTIPATTWVPSPTQVTTFTPVLTVLPVS
jgi:uncharacterized phage protein gp47/JayE